MVHAGPQMYLYGEGLCNTCLIELIVSLHRLASSASRCGSCQELLLSSFSISTFVLRSSGLVCASSSAQSPALTGQLLLCYPATASILQMVLRRTFCCLSLQHGLDQEPWGITRLPNEPVTFIMTTFLLAHVTPHDWAIWMRTSCLTASCDRVSKTPY